MNVAAPHDRLYIAAVNPLDPNGNVDEAQLRSLLRYFLAELPIAPDLGLIINPEAGEIFYLSQAEQERVLTIALDEVNGAVPVFAGVLANSTQDTVSAARRIASFAVDGLFIMPPIGAMDITIAWNPDRYPEVWGDMIGAIVDAVPDRPLICHPVAAPTAGYGAGLPYGATMQLLTDYPQIVGWKMTYNYEGFRRLTRGIRSLDHHVGILGATGVNFHENLASGAFDGTVSGSFNYALEPMLAHIAAWRDGDVELALKIWNNGLAELHEYIYEDWGRLHVRYKAATWLRGVIGSPFMRPPLPKPRRAEITALRDLLVRTELSVRDDDEVAAMVQQLPR